MYNPKTICTNKGYIKDGKLYAAADYDAICNFCGGIMQFEDNEKKAKKK